LVEIEIKKLTPKLTSVQVIEGNQTTWTLLMRRERIKLALTLLFPRKFQVLTYD